MNLQVFKKISISLSIIYAVQCFLVVQQHSSSIDELCFLVNFHQTFISSKGKYLNCYNKKELGKNYKKYNLARIDRA